MKLFRFAYSFSKYSSQNHSLLQQIYSYNYRDHYIAYLLLDHQSKSIISIDPGDFEAAFYNIKNLEVNSGYKLNYILQTHGRSNHTSSVLELYSKFKDAKVYSGIVENKLGTLFQTDFAREFQPFQIGDLAICFIQANGHTFDNYMIAVTDTNAQSTKIPILFSGDTILVNNVGEIEDYGAFFATLQKLRGFHDETLIFPGHLPQQEVFLFAKTLEPDNIIVQNKMGLDNLIPTSLIEERMGNPYFRYSQLNGKVKESDPIKRYEKEMKYTEKISYHVQEFQNLTKYYLTNYMFEQKEKCYQENIKSVDNYVNCALQLVNQFNEMSKKFRYQGLYFEHRFVDCLKHRPDEGDNYKCIQKLERDLKIEAKKITPKE